MARILINGGVPLEGDVWISGAKNAVLPILVASILGEGTSRVSNVPHLQDVSTTMELLGRMGAELYERLSVAAGHLKRVGGGLESAVNNYNKFVGSFERNVLSSGKRLADKGIEIGKREIEEVPLVEAAPRYNAEDAAESDSAFPALSESKDAAE